MTLWWQVAEAIRQKGAACLIRIERTEGSSPREAGATILLQPDGGFTGTIGGGALEHEVLALGLALLAAPPAGVRRRFALGPGLGQCCGGAVEVRLDVYGPDDSGWIAPLARAGMEGPVDTQGVEDGAGRLIRRLAAEGAGGPITTFGLARTPVQLFGAGHVGRALVLALAPLPFSVRWIDSRAEAFPDHCPINTVLERRDDPLLAMDEAAPGTLAAVMTHSHALDLALVSRALPDRRFGYVGLIGSASKRARFEGMMRRAGLAEGDIARLVCPIGGRGLADKHPAVIAAAIAYELLKMREALAQSAAGGGAVSC